MEFRTLYPDELDAWASHCAGVFTAEGHAVDKAYFLRHFNNDPWRDINGIFVAMDGHEIASTIRVFRRRVWLLGTEIPMGGIGEVSTKPVYRGLGLAGTLLKMAAKWMADEKMPVSVLYSELHEFYRRFGWECIPKPLRWTKNSPDLPCEGRALKLNDLSRLMAIDAASAKTNWMTVRDSPEYWQSWISTELGNGIAATDSGEIVAWLAYSTADESWSVTEFKALPGFEHKFDGLCALAAAANGLQGQPYTAPAWLPSSTDDFESCTATYTMVRLNIPFKAGGVDIGSTHQLIEATGGCQDSNLDHF